MKNEIRPNNNGDNLHTEIEFCDVRFVPKGNRAETQIKNTMKTSGARCIWMSLKIYESLWKQGFGLESTCHVNRNGQFYIFY